MKKFSRLLSALLAVILVAGLVPMAQINAVAADVPTLSLNVVSETNSEVKVTINLDSGSFLAADVSLKLNNSNFTCTAAYGSDELFDFETELKKDTKNSNACVDAAFKDTMKCSVATTKAYNKVGPIFVFTFKKAASTKLVKADIELKCSSLKNGSGTVVTPKLVNNVRVSAEPLKAPTVKGSNVASTGKIKLSWDAVSGAVKYNVYRASKKTGTYKLNWSTTNTSYTNSSPTPGQTYYYKVCAVEADGTEGKMSEIVTRTCDCAKPVVKISGVASSGKNKLTWDAVKGAVSYKVYRATSKDGTYKLMKTTLTTSYTNTSAVAGTKYYYKVKAIGTKEAANSAYSDVVVRTCDLKRPTIKVALNSKGNPKVSWSKIDGAVAYEVYRATGEYGEYKLLKTTTSTSFTNTSFKAKTTYCYKVIAVHSNTAANSAYSKAAKVTTK